MNWSASITEGSGWLSITFGGTGVNTGTVNINYSANSTSSSRTGKILVTSNGAIGSPKEVTIIQSEVKISIPIPPIINLQLNGSIINPLNGVITWNSSSNATRYRIQISKDSNFINIVKDITITDTTLTFTDLEGGTTYYLRINASNSLGSSAWSNTFMFNTSITSLSKPILLLPLNNALNQPTSVLLKWNSVKNATSYSLLLSKDSDFAIIQREFSGITDTSKSITGLENNTTYFWKTNAKSQSLESEWSEVWRFNVLVVGIKEIPNDIPNCFNLHQNYPNPFNPTTMISYQLPINSYVSLKIFDIYGKEINILMEKYQNRGKYSIKWEPNNIPSGVYFYELKTNKYMEMKKMLYLR